MLSDFNMISTLGVADLQPARDFYEGVLGFANPRSHPMVLAASTCVLGAAADQRGIGNRKD